MARIIPIEEAARRLGLAVEEAEALARAGRLRVRVLWERRYLDPRDLEAASLTAPEARRDPDLPPRPRKAGRR